MAALRGVILKANTGIVEEVKWKKPSKPEGVAVWALHGNLCHIDLLKDAVRLTFHKGVKITDTKRLFNTRLDSSTVRAIDFGPGARIDSAGIQALVRQAIQVNAGKSS